MTKIKLFLTVYMLTFLSQQALCQKEGNNWYFGKHAGISFQSGSPVSFTHNAISNQIEGVSAISDTAGNILFYTDGMDVYNKNDQIMTNGQGLQGDISSSQSALIVRKPGSLSHYYIFTVPSSRGTTDGRPGLTVSEVDMQVENGLGKVVVKNNTLLGHSSERLTAVRHGNSRDIWVLSMNDEYKIFAWLLTDQGLTDQPVETYFSQFDVRSFKEQTHNVGYMKATLDGRTVACALHGINKVLLLQFDPLTGIFANPLIIRFPYWQDLPYGIEFSPDGKLLYVSSEDYVDLSQFQISSWNQFLIERSRVNLLRFNGGPRFAALYMGPDQKIYQAVVDKDYLNVIHNPNAVGFACNFERFAVDLKGRKSLLGLQNLINDYWNPPPEIIAKAECLGDTVFLGLINSGNVQAVSWDFDDPASGAENTSPLINPAHVFSGAGAYEVSAQFILKSGDTLSSAISLSIYPRPMLNHTDTTFCEGESIWLAAPATDVKYLWQDGSRDSTFLAQEEGIYWVETTDPNGCVYRDSMQITAVYPLPQIDLGNDTTLCLDEMLLLDPNPDIRYAAYTWQNGSQEPSLIAAERGSYSVEVETEYGCIATDIIKIGPKACEAKITFPNVFTPNGDGINDGFGPFDYQALTGYELILFDRWGRQMFSANSLDMQWDGRFQGKDCSAGVYYWVARISDEARTEVVLKGSVMLMR